MSNNATEINKSRSYIYNIVHNLDKRAAVLEAEYSHIKQGLDDCQNKLSSIENKVDKINGHIARQNGLLPNIEASLSTALSKLQEHDRIVTVSSTRSRLIWISLSGIATGLIIFLIKTLLGG